MWESYEICEYILCAECAVSESCNLWALKIQWVFRKIFSLHRVYFVEFLSFSCLTDESGWWQGRLQGKEGLLPANYVQKLWYLCADLSQLVLVPHLWETRIAASPFLLHEDIMIYLIYLAVVWFLFSLYSVCGYWRVWSTCSLSLSVCGVVFMMFLFAIFIVVQTYPDLLNTYAPWKHEVMQKHPKSAYRLTLRNGSYIP